MNIFRMVNEKRNLRHAGIVPYGEPSAKKKAASFLASSVSTVNRGIDKARNVSHSIAHSQGAANVRRAGRTFHRGAVALANSPSAQGFSKFAKKVHSESSGGFGLPTVEDSKGKKGPKPMFDHSDLFNI